MNILKRRNRSRSTVSPSASVSNSALSERLTNFQSTLSARWQALTPRDQLALGFLSLFLLLFIGVYGGYSVNQLAKDSKEDYQQQVADYFWLRSQAGNIDTNANSISVDGAIVAPATSINSLLNSAGINDAQVAAVGDDVQLSFTNSSQALVSAALNKLNEQGWQFTQLSMQQDINTKQITVQATVAS